jgi:hypothetical protein
MTDPYQAAPPAEATATATVADATVAATAAEPLVYTVRITKGSPCDADAQPLVGKATMEIDENGIRLIRGRKGKVNHFRSWQEVSELSTELDPKDMFTVNFGQGKKDWVLKVKVLEGDKLAVNEMLAAAPEDSRLPKCPSCAAPLDGDTCQACGKNAKATYRLHGLLALGIGTVLAIVGTVVTILSYTSAGPGDSYTILWGPVALGVLMALAGGFKLVTGKR